MAELPGGANNCTSNKQFNVMTPGDYDGDGKADMAVWRTSDGNWYAKLRRDNSVPTKVHGQLGDSPALAKSRPQH